MEYPDFRVDFVDRTIEILEKLSDKTDYEVTLLINCLFGLIVIPTEVDYRKLNANYKEDFVNFCTMKLEHYSTVPKRKSKRQLARCMKNALSHLYIDTIPKDDKISTVIFKDKLKNATDFHTIIEFSVDGLKQFALDMARHYSDIIRKRKRAK